MPPQPSEDRTWLMIVDWQKHTELDFQQSTQFASPCMESRFSTRFWHAISRQGRDTSTCSLVHALACLIRDSTAIWFVWEYEWSIFSFLLCWFGVSGIWTSQIGIVGRQSHAEFGKPLFDLIYFLLLSSLSL
jgi:hypothetical protein